jgi:hypothetical protein
MMYVSANEKAVSLNVHRYIEAAEMAKRNRAMEMMYARQSVSDRYEDLQAADVSFASNNIAAAAINVGTGLSLPHKSSIC